jgi:molybdopterin molybdotransferase
MDATGGVDDDADDGDGGGPPDVATALERLLGAVDPHGRTDRVPLTSADGRVLADPVDLPATLAGGDGGDGRPAGGRYDPGHRVRPSDLGLLKAAGVDRVPVADRPTVGVVPTGEGLVQRDPGPGEAVETDGLVVATLAERWGAVPRYRNVVTDDPPALRAAVQRDLTKDVVVTTGGTGGEARDHVGRVVADLGEVRVDGVAATPGRTVAVGVVAETPVVMLPGDPAACVVGAVQFLRPVLARLAGAPRDPVPTVAATLARGVESAPGTRTFVPVRVDAGGGGTRRAVPLPAESGPTGVARVARADGWVVVPEGRDGHPAGEAVDVERWEPPA